MKNTKFHKKFNIKMKFLLNQIETHMNHFNSVIKRTQKLFNFIIQHPLHSECTH